MPVQFISRRRWQKKIVVYGNHKWTSVLVVHVYCSHRPMRHQNSATNWPIWLHLIVLPHWSCTTTTHLTLIDIHPQTKRHYLHPLPRTLEPSQ